MQPELHETAVRDALSTRWLGRDYRYYPSIGSTNETLKAMLAAGGASQVSAGTVLLADYQSQGKGRLDRRWSAPPHSSLLLSILFRPGWPAEQGQWLTMLGSLAAAEAMEACSPLKVAIKWPNDLVISIAGKWHKVSGMLLEGSVDASGKLESAILGIGMNVNILEADLPSTVTPATSLLAAGGRTISRLDLLVDFLGRMERYYEASDGGQSPQLAWKQRLITLGRPVQVTHVDQKRITLGIAEGTDEWGQLLVRDDNGLLHTVSAGDVTLRESST